MKSVEPLQFTNSRGHCLTGLLHHPSSGASRAAVIVSHGMLSSKASEKHRQLCSAVARLGHLAFRFDFSGRGESEGSPEAISFTGEIDDLRSAMTVLRQRGARQLALVGSSMGGAVSLLVAAGEPELAALVTMAAPAFLKDRLHSGWPAEVLEEARRTGRLELAPGVFISMNFFEDAHRYDVLAEAAKIRAPWLIVHGRKDDVVPVADAEALAAANPRAIAEFHQAADHRFSTETWRSWLVACIVDFLCGVL